MIWFEWKNIISEKRRFRMSEIKNIKLMAEIPMEIHENVKKNILKRFAKS